MSISAVSGLGTPFAYRIAQREKGVIRSMPLNDIRILDLTRGLSGSLATKYLANYGAEVVKIEPPDGGPHPPLRSHPERRKPLLPLSLRREEERPAGLRPAGGRRPAANAPPEGRRGLHGLPPLRSQGPGPGLREPEGGEAGPDSGLRHPLRPHRPSGGGSRLLSDGPGPVRGHGYDRHARAAIPSSPAPASRSITPPGTWPPP